MRGLCARECGGRPLFFARARTVGDLLVAELFLAPPSDAGQP